MSHYQAVKNLQEGVIYNIVSNVIQGRYFRFITFSTYRYECLESDITVRHSSKAFIKT